MFDEVLASDNLETSTGHTKDDDDSSFLDDPK